MFRYFWLKATGEIKEITHEKALNLDIKSKSNHCHKIISADGEGIGLWNFTYIDWDIIKKIKAIIEGGK